MAFSIRALTFAFAAIAALTGAALQAEPCGKQIVLSPRPAWVSSAIWVPAPVNKILAVDSALNRLTLYGTDGKGTVLTDQLLPSYVTVSGNRILLALVGQGVLALDAKTLAFEDGPHSLLKEAKTAIGAAIGVPLAAVYQLLGVDHSLLATGLVMDSRLPKEFQAGLFRLSASEEGPRTAELLLPVEAWDYLVLSYQYLTSTPAAGGTGYFLDMDHGTAHLFEIPPGGKPHELVGAVPPEVRTVPHISAVLNGPKDAPPLFAKLASLKLATGIFGGADGNVYLLAREPVNGTILWWLYRISPGGALLGKALLPTHAQHLSIVVSPETFYLFERGTVNPYGGQAIETMVPVPAKAIEQAPLQGIEVCSAGGQ